MTFVISHTPISVIFLHFSESNEEKEVLREPNQSNNNTIFVIILLHNHLQRVSSSIVLLVYSVLISLIMRDLLILVRISLSFMSNKEASESR